MKTVFVVTSGIYSDFGIEAVFSTKEKAEEFVKNLDGFYKGEIKEWAVDINERESSFWYVEMTRDGDVIATEPVHNENDHRGFGRDNLLTVVRATTKERAIKVANERRIRLIVNNEW